LLLLEHGDAGTGRATQQLRLQLAPKL